MDNYTFIMAIKELKSISDICNELNINYSNLLHGKTSKENEKKVADVLKLEILKAYCYVKGAD